MSPIFDSPVKKTKVKFYSDERMLNVDGLFRGNGEQPDRRTDTDIMQQQMLHITRSLEKGERPGADAKSAQGDTEDKRLTRGKSSESKIALEIEMQKKIDTDKFEKKEEK